MGTDIIVKAQVKEAAKIDDKVLNVAAEFYDALSKKVSEMVKEACKRARANGRNTLMAKDV